MSQSRRIRRGRPGQRGGRQAPGLDAGLAREAHGGRRAAVRRAGPAPTSPACRARTSSTAPRSPSYFRRGAEFGIAARRLEGRHGRRPRPQAEDGRRAGRDAPRRSTGRAARSSSWASGRFVAPKTIEVALNAGGTRTLRGQTVVIDTGSRARIDDTPGLAESRPLTHVEALELDRAPGTPDRPGRRLRGPRAGAGVPPLRQPRDGRRAERRADPPRGPGRHRGGRAALPGRGDRGPDRDRRRSRRGDDPASPSACTRRRGAIEGTHLLVAGGRTPNTDGIGLETAGVETDERGHVKVDERLRTTAEGVWAAGDCAGSPYFTHIGEDDFRVVLANLTGGDRVTTGRQVPFCLFTDPELARVGLSEREARERGVGYRLAKIPMEAVLRARTLSETRGFLKALIEEDGDRILGFTAFGPEAGEVMAVVQVAMLAGLPYTALRDAVLTHPTMAEGLAALFSSVPRG